MTNDTRPPVAPVEGHYAMLRNGMISRPQMSEWPEDPVYLDAYLEIYWDKDGKAQPATKAESDVRHAPKYDIIATISPSTMAVAAAMKPPIGDPVIKLGANRLEAYKALIPLADAACDYADSHCRAFPIATAPREGYFFVWNDVTKDWYGGYNYEEMLFIINESHGTIYTHWMPTPPPPSTPPLPAVFVELGAALEKLKSQP